jgi:hypothetical protein
MMPDHVGDRSARGVEAAARAEPASKAACARRTPRGAVGNGARFGNRELRGLFFAPAQIERGLGPEDEGGMRRVRQRGPREVSPHRLPVHRPAFAGAEPGGFGAAGLAQPTEAFPIFRGLREVARTTPSGAPVSPPSQRLERGAGVVERHEVVGGCRRKCSCRRAWRALRRCADCCRRRRRRR